jgi:hypothetical protein
MNAAPAARHLRTSTSYSQKRPRSCRAAPSVRGASR